MSKPVYIMVLSDGTTYTGLSGCMIVRTTEDAIHEADDEVPNGKIIATFGTTYSNNVDIRLLDDTIVTVGH